jgi:hypothetical protein
MYVKHECVNWWFREGVRKATEGMESVGECEEVPEIASRRAQRAESIRETGTEF